MKDEFIEFVEDGSIRLFMLFILICGVLVAIFCFDLGIIQYKEPVEDPESEEIYKDNYLIDELKIFYKTKYENKKPSR